MVPMLGIYIFVNSLNHMEIVVLRIIVTAATMIISNNVFFRTRASLNFVLPMTRDVPL